MGFLSGVASVVGNVAGGLLQGYQNRKAAQKANKYNYTAWQLQNEYNTPKEQRERLEEAGYNPNLWYTQGNTGNAGTLATTGYQAADWQGMTNRALSGLAQYQQVEAQEAGILNTEANTENTKVQKQILAHNLKYAEDHNLPVGMGPVGYEREYQSILDIIKDLKGKLGKKPSEPTVPKSYNEDPTGWHGNFLFRWKKGR